MKPLKLRGRKNCEFIRRKGLKWQGKTFVARLIVGPPKNRNTDDFEKGIYLGTYATTRMHKSAVKRNKMRRRCREAIRKNMKEWTKKIPTVQLLISPKLSSLTCEFSVIDQEAQELLEWIAERDDYFSTTL